MSTCQLQNAPMDPTATRQLRNLPGRHITTPSQPAPPAASHKHVITAPVQAQNQT